MPLSDASGPDLIGAAPSEFGGRPGPEKDGDGRVLAASVFLAATLASTTHLACVHVPRYKAA
jgi:hypothetical protein